MEVDPGDMNRQMTIQARSATKGAQGGQSVTWTDVATVWVRIRPATSNIMKSAREVFASNAQMSEQLSELTIAYRPGITAAHRGVVNGRIFNFGHPINVNEENQWLVIPGTEGMNNG